MSQYLDFLNSFYRFSCCLLMRSRRIRQFGATVTTKICQILCTNYLQSTENDTNDADYPNCNIDPEEETIKEGTMARNM